MLLPIKLICRTKRIHHDGTATVFIQYCYSATQKTLLHTGVKIPPAFWNKKQSYVSDKLPAVFGNFQQINFELKRQLRIAEDLITFAIKTKVDDKGAFTKKNFSPSLDTTSIAHQVEQAVEKEVTQKKAKLDGSYIKVLNHFERVPLIILDDFGLQPLDQTMRVALLQILEDRYAKKSVIITSQLPVAKWHTYINEPTLGDAILDRLTARSQRIELKGESMRRKKQ